MPEWNFIWSGDIEDHVAEHGVTPEEFEQVMRSGLVRGPEESRSTPGHLVGWGFTDAGRRLIVVFLELDGSTLLPVTAYEPD